MAFARLYISKFSQGRIPPDPPTTLAAMQLVGQTNVRPPKFLGPYAYGSIKQDIYVQEYSFFRFSQSQPFLHLSDGEHTWESDQHKVQTLYSI